MIQGWGRFNRPVWRTVMDRLISRAAFAAGGGRESGLVKDIDKAKRLERERAHNRQTLGIDRVDPPADRRRDTLVVPEEIASAFLDPSRVAEHAGRMHDRIDVRKAGVEDVGGGNDVGENLLNLRDEMRRVLPRKCRATEVRGAPVEFYFSGFGHATDVSERDRLADFHVRLAT